MRIALKKEVQVLSVQKHFKKVDAFVLLYIKVKLGITEILKMVLLRHIIAYLPKNINLNLPQASCNTPLPW